MAMTARDRSKKPVAKSVCFELNKNLSSLVGGKIELIARFVSD